MAKKIVVLGDSLSAQQNMYEAPWPELLRASMRAGGEDVDVVNLSTNGYTCFDAMNVPTYGTATPAQQCVAEAPNLVIVALGVNDSWRVAGLGLAAVQAEVKALYDYLHANLPGATLIYASETPFDKVHGNPANLLNRQSLPIFFQLNTTGLFANLFCPEMLGNLSRADYRASMTGWVALDSYIKGLPTVNGSFEFPLWQCARLGLTGADGLHITDVGQKVVHAAARDAMYELPAARAVFPKLSTQNIGTPNSWNTWSKFFSLVLQDNSVEYVSKTPAQAEVHVMQYYGPWAAEVLNSWYLPSHGTHNTSTTNYTRGGSQVWTVTGATPNAPVYTSVNGDAWSLHPRLTDSRGGFLDAGSLDNLADGTYAFRYRVANEAFPVVNMTVGGTAIAKADGSNASGTWPIQISGPSAMQRQGLFTKRSMANGLVFASSIKEPLEMPDATAFGLLSAANISTEGKLFKGCRLSTGASGDCWVRVTARGSVIANSAGSLVWLGLFIANASGSVTNNMVLGGTYSSPRASDLASFNGETVIKLPPGYYAAPWIYVVGGGSSVADGVSGNFWEFTANVIY